MRVAKLTIDAISPYISQSLLPKKALVARAIPMFGQGLVVDVAVGEANGPNVVDVKGCDSVQAICVGDHSALA